MSIAGRPSFFLLIAAIVAVASPSPGQVLGQATMQVSATLEHPCTFYAGSLDFGVVDGKNNVPKGHEATVTCEGPGSINVSVDVPDFSGLGRLAHESGASMYYNVLLFALAVERDECINSPDQYFQIREPREARLSLSANVATEVFICAILGPVPDGFPGGKYDGSLTLTFFL
jgi:hypothetical protein